MAIWNTLREYVFSTDFLATVIRLTAPLIFAAMGGLVSRRGGIMNLNLEGTMIIGAFSGVFFGYYAKQWWGNIPVLQNMDWLFGVLMAIVICLLVGAVFIYLGIYLKANLTLTALAINMFAQGMTIFILINWAGEKGTSLNRPSPVTPIINIPLIKDIPILGDIISGQRILAYVAYLSIFVVWYFIFKTATGLRIRAVGENPNAAESVGVNVKRQQTIAILVTSALCALGGCYLSMGYVSWFGNLMVAGRGFIGVAAMNLGNAAPLGTTLAAFLFGFAEAAAFIFQKFIPIQYALMIPYVVTLLGLIFYAVKEDRALKKRKAQR